MNKVSLFFKNGRKISDTMTNEEFDGMWSAFASYAVKRVISSVSYDPIIHFNGENISGSFDVADIMGMTSEPIKK